MSDVSFMTAASSACPVGVRSYVTIVLAALRHGNSGHLESARMM